MASERSGLSYLFFIVFAAVALVAGTCKATELGQADSVIPARVTNALGKEEMVMVADGPLTDNMCKKPFSAGGKKNCCVTIPGPLGAICVQECDPEKKYYCCTKTYIGGCRACCPVGTYCCERIVTGHCKKFCEYGTTETVLALE